jgi:hypothetical protein
MSNRTLTVWIDRFKHGVRSFEAEISVEDFKKYPTFLLKTN